MGANGFSLIDETNLNFPAGLLGQIHQVDGTGQIRRAASDKQNVKFQCFSGFFHLQFPYFSNLT